MDNPLIKKILPHILAYVLMALVAVIFFKPYVFDGKVFYQHDNAQANGAITEQYAFRAIDGNEPLWTNSMFAGMPTYQIHQQIRGNFAKPIFRALMLWQSIKMPHIVLLLAMACCYFLLIVLRVDWRLSVLAAITYGLSSYNIDLALTGHSTKLVALAILPALFAGVIMAYRGKYLFGAAMFALVTNLHIYANHFQITYYAYILIGIYAIFQLVKAVREGTIPSFVKTSAILGVAAILGIMSNTSKLWPTQEYASETIRGKSELTTKASKGDGLDKDYAFGWSMGIGESMTMFVPQYKGGGANQTYKGTKTYNRLYRGIESRNMQQGGMSKQAAQKNAEKQVSLLFYFGGQTYVGMPIYFGAVICFLFFLGCFTVQGEMKWWLIASAILMVTISWGKNFFVNHLLFDYFPFFNKFRSLSMALGLGQLIFIVLAALGLQAVVSKELDIAKKKRALYIALGISGVFALIALFSSVTGDFSGRTDAQIGAELTSLIKQDRASLVRSDAFRSLLLVLLSGGLIWAMISHKIKALYGVMAIGLLSVFDVGLVAKRNLYPSKYETPKALAAAEEPLPVDKEILKDTDPHYRVLDLTTNPFASARVSLFHKSMGGYHAAKLMRYQDLIERYLSNPNKGLHVLGMLNAKYIIQSGEGSPARASKNPKALCNEGFVYDYKIVENGDAEMDGLATLDPATTALVQKSFAQPLDGFNITPDPNATIKLTNYHPDRMTYNYTAATEQLALFSEVYYPPSKGWNMYLDDKPMDPFIKANFLLRAARLPAGQHKLEMRFEPRSYYLGENISRVASILVLLGFFASMYFFFRKYSLPKINHLDDVASAQKVAIPTVRKKAVATASKTTTKTEKNTKTSKKKKRKK